ncbi:DNA/RNA helicase domain-containing protein [Streptomyces cucumeris]|uniref:DNA/RNA helicase domain-containing protein n=1 Tax=Streptomyces cucumeris TaxID=2962890 RepID=UPI003D718888
MLIRQSVASVAAEMHSGSLYFHLTDNFAHAHGHKPSDSEVRSWKHSLPALVNALLEAGLDEVEMMIEYTLPLTSKRADAILAGVHPKTGEPSYVVIELKQWSEAHPDEDSPHLCLVPGMYSRPVLNPIEQVRGYCDYLAQFNGALDGNEHRIVGAAYLHNATEFGAGGLDVVEQSTSGRLFTGDRRGAFIEFLRDHLAATSGALASDAFIGAATQPSTQLIGVAASEIRDREQFRLLSEQKLAYELVLKAVRNSRQADSKEVIVVSGGPGSGKSVIALSLLGELYRQGRSALHATGSASFTKTMRKVAGARKREVQNLFKYFNSFMTADPNGFDVLICDEAHRVRETSANRYTPAENRTGKPQVDELIDAARVPVFLLDDHQIVRPGEMGSVREIKAAAARKGLRCTVVSLDSQFRCGGSDAYLRWVLRLLDLEPGGPIPWEPDSKMQLMVAETPQQMEEFLQDRLEDNKSARMSAGYCWKWTTKVAPGQALPTDVVIGDWARPWNVYGDRAVAGAPPAALWATDDAGFGQVGCVYTAQGFEYDWSGVIIGPDLVWRDDRWVVDRAASKDPVFKKSTPDDQVRRLVRNTYKVLLTRGMVGTVIYSTDAETRAKLRELVKAEVGATASVG